MQLTHFLIGHHTTLAHTVHQSTDERCSHHFHHGWGKAKPKPSQESSETEGWPMLGPIWRSKGTWTDYPFIYASHWRELESEWDGSTGFHDWKGNDTKNHFQARSTQETEERLNLHIMPWRQCLSFSEMMPVLPLSLSIYLLGCNVDEFAKVTPVLRCLEGSKYRCYVDWWCRGRHPEPNLDNIYICTLSIHIH